MDYKNTHFPQYRKLLNGQRLYKINSLDSFEEIQIMGEKVFHFIIIAEQYPEKLRIMDMLVVKSETYLPFEASDWDEVFVKI